MEGGERLHRRGADARRCTHALRRIATGPVDARRHEKGIYLIERAEETLVAVLREYDDGRQIRTTAPIFEPPQRLGLLSTATSAGVMHRRQMPIRWLTAEGYGRSLATRGTTMREIQNRSTT